MYLLDTNICIYAIKGKYPVIAEKLLSIHPDEIKISFNAQHRRVSARAGY